MVDFRVGHQFLVGKTTLSTFTIIDIISSNLIFTVVGEGGKVKTDFRVDDEDIFSHYTNNITQPETQNTEGRFTVEGGSQDNHASQWENGTKVSFEVDLKGAMLKVEGYIVRNYWSSYYLLSEVGVSVPDRYWKFSHSKCTLVV